MSMREEKSSSILPQPGQPAKLLYCPRCFELVVLSPYDDAPAYTDDGSASAEGCSRNRENFFSYHADHGLRTLQKKPDRFWADRPAWDPLRVAYQEVTDGYERFLLKSWRTNLDEPRSYTLLRGTLALTTQVTLPADPLQDMLTDTLQLSPARVTDFVQVCQRAVATLPADEFIPAYCSAHDPQIAFAYLAEHHVPTLVRCCGEVGASSEEKERLHDFFIDSHQGDELTVEMRYTGQIQFT